MWSIFLRLISAQRLADRAQISHTRFMRTTRWEHHEAVESVWVRIIPSHNVGYANLSFASVNWMPVDSSIKTTIPGGTPSPTNVFTRTLKSPPFPPLIRAYPPTAQVSLPSIRTIRRHTHQSPPSLSKQVPPLNGTARKITCFDLPASSHLF
jgi:hypothetical protein